MRKLMLTVMLILCLVFLGSCDAPAEEGVHTVLSFLHLPVYHVSTVSISHSFRPVGMDEQSIASPIYLLDVGGKRFLCDYNMTVYDGSGQNYLILGGEARETLLRLRDDLHDTVFGLPIEWKAASRLFPRMAVAEVKDIVTGHSFRVQRRGGTYHADVQFLTRVDTGIMKEIYNNAWSWDRRAVILSIDGSRLAASMNGMPHGQGALQNDFPGHFCIHFIGSTTHGSRDVDPGHMLMIAKAAGTVWNVAREATPEQQARNFIAAFNQKDMWLAKLFADPETASHIERAMDAYETINLKQVTIAGPALEACELDLDLEVIHKGG